MPYIHNTYKLPLHNHQMQCMPLLDLPHMYIIFQHKPMHKKIKSCNCHTTYAPKHTLNLLQINIHRITNTWSWFTSYMNTALMQEIKLSPQTTLPTFSNYTAVKDNKTQYKVGLVILLCNSIHLSNKTR